MKEFYNSPQLNIICFASVERLSSDKISISMERVGPVTYAAGNEASQEEGDIFFPIPTP